MRIGILTQYYPPEFGAPQARLSDLARRAANAGHDVHVLTAMPNYPRGSIYPGYGGLRRREVMDGVSVVRSYVYPTKSIKTVPRLGSYFSFTLSSLTVGAASLPRLDYLITESPPLFLGMSGYLLSRMKGARWVFNVSDLWPASAVRLGVIGQGWSLTLASRLEAFCYRKAWLVTGQSKETVDDIQRRFPGVDTYHLSNGVDTTLFSPKLRCAGVRRELADGNGCVAVYAGLHGIAQGLDQVLDAAVRLKDLDRLGIVLVGDGPEKEHLVNRSRALGLTNVEFWSPRPHASLPALLASADIALVPLKDVLPGSVPSKVYEAMASGVPVVLSADGEAADIVRTSEAGIVVRPGDSSALASALRRLSQDPAQRAELGSAGRRASESRFDRRTIGEKFLRLLEERL